MLPIWPVTKEALSLVWHNPKLVFQSIFMILGFVVSAVLLSVLIGKIGLPLFGVLIAIILVLCMLILFAHIFNVWVRIGAHGPASAFDVETKTALRRAAVNGLKLTLIGAVYVLVQGVVVAILSILGIAGPVTSNLASGSFQEIMSNDFTQIYLDGLTVNLVAVIVSSFIYAIFSANLTSTALGRPKQEMSSATVQDFAVVLILLYAVLTVITLIAALTKVTVIYLIAGFAVSIFISFAVPAAHGIRYRLMQQKLDAGNDGISGEV